MNRAAAFRGQPLLLLAGIFLAWLGARAALWQSPLPLPAGVGIPDFSRPVPRAPEVLSMQRLASPERQAPRLAAMRAWPVSPVMLDLRIPVPAVESVSSTDFAATASAPGPSRASMVVGHNLLLAAGLSHMELPPFLLAYLQGAPVPPGVPAAAPLLVGASKSSAALAVSRWSADGWLLLRQDTTASFASDRPSYGRSQAGAVVRYALAPASGHRPQAYVRASTALSGARERELAAGFSARPLAGMPVRLAAEARVSDTRDGTALRPAVYAVSEFPPVELPLGTRSEAYLQAGYVGGRFATAFVDGQGRIERPLARWGEAELVAGAGAWGGAQKGSARLDIGPTAALAFRLGDARGRLAADYRFRVAGGAEPSSGPAVTISAGF